MARTGPAGYRSEVIGVRLSKVEAERYVHSRRGALTASAYVRWVLMRAGEVDPHADRSTGAVEVTNFDGDVVAAWVEDDEEGLSE